MEKSTNYSFKAYFLINFHFLSNKVTTCFNFSKLKNKCSLIF